MEMLWKSLFAAFAVTVFGWVSAGCTSTSPPDNNYTVSGSVAGLNGTLELLNISTNEVVSTTSASFSFSPQASAANYDIQIYAQPVGQSCSVTNASGVITDADVSNVQVNCVTDTFVVGGTVNGLVGTIDLRNVSTGEVIQVSAGSFSFSTQEYGTNYDVQILDSAQGQTCTIEHGQGEVSAVVDDIRLSCSTDKYSISGSIIGLIGSAEITNTATNEVVEVSGNVFGFSEQAFGSNYALVLTEQPLGQTCTLGNASGTVGAGDVTGILLSCSTNSYAVSGVIRGLIGNITLLNAATAEAISVSNGDFSFQAQPFASNYAIQVNVQPKGQVCSVANAEGVIGSGSITNVRVSCATNSYGVSGLITGLIGTIGLTNTVTGEVVEVDGNSFSFAEQDYGASFAIQVSAQPQGQSCSIENTSGMLSDADVNNIQVSCITNSYGVAGSITGLIGSIGLTNTVTGEVIEADDDSFSFSEQDYGASFAIQISAQPQGQSCSIENASGALSDTDVNNIQVRCTTNSYGVAGSITGLIGSIGLTNTVTGEVIEADDDSFSFAEQDYGTSFVIQISTQPQGQSCSIENASGALSDTDVNNIQVSCITNSYGVAGSITGLIGTIGLTNTVTGEVVEVVEVVEVDGNSFSFAEQDYGASFAIQVSTQPQGQSCSIENASGTLSDTDVNNIQVRCTTNSYGVAGSITGLIGTIGLTNTVTGEVVEVDGNSFSFAEQDYGASFAIQVSAQPQGQSCSIENASGTLSDTDVNNIQVRCTTNSYGVAGSITGLIGSIGLTNTVTGEVIEADDDSFSFAEQDYGTSFVIQISAQPQGQNCSIENASGVLSDADVNNIQVSCTTNSYGVAGSITGLIGTIGLTNTVTGEVVEVDGNSFSFAEQDYGASFAIQVSAQPQGQSCSIENASGTLSDTDVNNIQVRCTTNSYGVAGLITGLIGTIGLTNTVTGEVIEADDDSFSFAGQDYGTSFVIQISTQPQGQSCSIENASGVLSDADVNNIQVSCTTNSYSVSGSITGLIGTIGLTNTVTGEVIEVDGDSFSFAEQDYGSRFSIQVSAQPYEQVCSLSNDIGVVGVGGSIDTNISCRIVTYPLSVEIAGLEGELWLTNTASGEELEVNTDSASFAMEPLGASYNIVITGQPVTQRCKVFQGEGVVGREGVHLIVQCSPLTEKAPLITSVVPSLFEGGDEVHISGSHLADALISIDSRPVQVITQSEHSIKFVAPDLGPREGRSPYYRLLADNSAGEDYRSVIYKRFVKAKSLDTNGRRTCFVNERGSVFCWENLGQGPLNSIRLSGAISVSLGASHSCALIDDGTINCWGANHEGQLGNSGYDHENIVMHPITVADIDDAVQLASGYKHSCILTGSGRVKCWGWNRYGQTGNGKRSAKESDPVEVQGIVDAVAVHAEQDYSCATLGNGSIKCWGRVFSGRDSFTEPQMFSNFSGANTVEFGPFDACAILESGRVGCLYQLGAAEAEVIEGLDDAIDLFPGGAHHCALRADRTLWCWGGNSRYQLGNGSDERSDVAVQVLGLENVGFAVAAGSLTCAVQLDDEVHCWGGDITTARRGRDGLEKQLAPFAVEGVRSAQAVVAGGSHSCLMNSEKELFCWGGNLLGQLGLFDGAYTHIPQKIDSSEDIYKIAAGKDHNCMLLIGGEVQCWGDNRSGQLGNSTVIHTPQPLRVEGVENAVDIALGARHSCALLSSGEVRCWGDNENWQLGVRNDTDNPIDGVVSVSNLGAATKISAGQNNSCAIVDGGQVYCWGQAGFGQAGGSGPSYPRVSLAEKVKGVSSAVDVAIGEVHSCALLADKRVVCWGSHYYGRLGGDTDYPASNAKVVDGISSAIEISLGDLHACALLESGKVSCWGMNTKGQLGSPNIPLGFFNRLDPIQPYSMQAKELRGLSDVAGLSCGSNHCCGVYSDGAVSCWGFNSLGAVGSKAQIPRVRERAFYPDY